MKHFDITRWTDFARGFAPDADRAAMEAHLLSGCARCRDTLQFVNRMVESARVDGRYQPPEHVVRCAKAISSLLSPRRSGLSRLVARLVGDALPDVALAGMRSQDRMSRHALYEAGRFYVDVRLEQEKGAALATLVGQLTNRDDPDTALAEAPVLLLSRKDIVAHAIYNRFGEFQMDYPPAPHLLLSIALGQPGTRIELSLKGFASELPTALPGRPASS
jgi:hypothetical protein